MAFLSAIMDETFHGYSQQIIVIERFRGFTQFYSPSSSLQSFILIEKLR